MHTFSEKKTTTVHIMGLWKRKAMAKRWANGVSSNPIKFGVKIKSHETTEAHLGASIAFGRWKTP